MRWQRKGTWKKILDILIDEPEYQFLMIDATYIKVHPDACSAVGGKQDMARTKGGEGSKIHLAVNEKGLPLAVSITSGTVADCSEAH